MQQPPPGQAGLFVHKCAQFLVAKVVPQRAGSVASSHFPDQALCDQSFQRRNRLFLTAATGFSQGPKVKRPANDSRRAEQLPPVSLTKARRECSRLRAPPAKTNPLKGFLIGVALREHGQVLDQKERSPRSPDIIAHSCFQIGLRNPCGQRSDRLNQFCHGDRLKRVNGRTVAVPAAELRRAASASDAQPAVLAAPSRQNEQRSPAQSPPDRSADRGKLRQPNEDRLGRECWRRAITHGEQYLVDAFKEALWAPGYRARNRCTVPAGRRLASSGSSGSFA